MRILTDTQMQFNKQDTLLFDNEKKLLKILEVEITSANFLQSV